MIYQIIHSLHIYKNHDEFYQIGLIALWEASNQFDETKGAFLSYAYATVKGRILTEIAKQKQDKRREIYIPRKNSGKFKLHHYQGSH